METDGTTLRILSEELFFVCEQKQWGGGSVFTRIFQRIILGLGIVFAAELLYLSLSFEAVSDFTYYSELLTQTNLNPLLQILKTALLIGVLMIVLRLLQRKKTEPDRKTAALITAVLACYTLCVSLYLNHINNVGL